MKHIKTGLAVMLTVLSVGLLLIQCTKKEASSMKIEKRDFGKTEAGQSAELYSLTNAAGMKVDITTYGGIITSIVVPDRDGNMGDVALGFDNIDDYIKKSPYFGCIVGRYGNRIAKGQFTLNDKTYTLAVNDGPNHLHGGLVGFDKVVWEAEEIRSDDAVGLKLSYLSKDGDEGYPGNLSVTVTYLLTNDNEIKILYEATTDQPTVCNLTNHTYFNLTDGGATPILDHQLTIDSDYLTAIDETSIPTGELMDVTGTPFDFRKSKKIGADIGDDHQQIQNGKGYDHNFALNGPMGTLRLAARAVDSVTGRVLEVLTEEPGVQLYTGNFLDGSITGKNGTVYKYRHGFCLETQHYPDSPNQPDFPSTQLNPGEKYQTTTVYKFAVEK